MPNVIGVRFRSAGKRHYVHPGSFSPLPGDTVIVPFGGGLSPAEVCEAARLRLTTLDSEARHG